MRDTARNQGLGSWTARRARRSPDRIALVHQGPDGRPVRQSYARLHARTRAIAAALRERHGVRPGDRVAYLGPNHPAFLETLFATGRLGAVFVPLNTRLTAPEIAYQLADCGARVLVHAPTHDALVRELPTAPGSPMLLPLARLAAAEAPPSTMDTELDDAPGTLDDPCMIMYTSGTTGRPKGAVLTHGNITWNSFNVLIDQDLAADEVALVSAPLFHTAALNMLALPVLLKGGTCVLAERFDVDATFDAIARHRVTVMFGVPAMFRQLADAPRWADADLSSLRMLNCGGAPVPPALITAYQRRGLNFCQGYGMTEAAPGTLFLAAEHAVDKAGSAGVPHFFTDVRVVRPDLTETVPGDVGEIVVRGPNVMPGYWGLPRESADAFTDGWLRTGDAARTDEDGHVTIVDRIKDMIISGGENVYPAEVENAIAGHPDVAECAVYGVPDARWGEVPHATVVLRPGASAGGDDVLRFLDGRLARYKLPKAVHVLPVLPRNAAGKVLKAELRGGGDFAAPG